MKKALLILAMVLVAGCTQPGGQGQSNQGIVIDSFYVSPKEVTDREPLDIFFKVENVGGKTASVTAYIYGPSWISETDILKEKTLIPPDRQTGSIGESFVYEKTYDRPVSVTKGLTEEYTLNGRICYPYKTSASTDVEIITLSEKRLTNAKQASRTVKTQNSDAPVHLEFTMMEPLVDYGDEGQETPIAVKVKDVGGGFATDAAKSCSKNPGMGEMNIVSISLKGDNIKDCNGTLHMVDGEATLFCKISSTTGSLPSKTISLMAEATYNYYKTKIATVRISGTS